MVERKLTDIIMREQGKYTAKAKEKMQEKEQESDSDPNLPHLSNTRVKLTTPIRSVLKEQLYCWSQDVMRALVSHKAMEQFMQDQQRNKGL